MNVLINYYGTLESLGTALSNALLLIRIIILYSNRAFEQDY